MGFSWRTRLGSTGWRTAHICHPASCVFYETTSFHYYNAGWNKKGKKGCSYLSGSWMVSTALPTICCSSWAAWSMTAVKMVRGKGKSQREGGVLGNVSFPLRHCGQQGPERDTEPQKTCLMLCVVLLKGVGSAATGVKPKEMSLQLLTSASYHVAHLHCESNTHILLPYNRNNFPFKWHTEEDMSFFIFSNRCLLLFSTKELRISSAEVHQMWARLISPRKLWSLCHMPNGNSTHLIIWYHLSTLFFQKLSSTYFVLFK